MRLEILGAMVLGVTSVDCVSFRWLAANSSRQRRGLLRDSGRVDVLWPRFRPTIRPDFSLTSFGMVAVVGVVKQRRVGKLNLMVSTPTSVFA